MVNKTTVFRVVLIALMTAALACNTILGGDSRVDDAQATADALQTEAAGVFDDLGDIATPDLEEPTDEEPSAEEEATDADGGTGGPDDVPVMEGDNENFFASVDVVTYLTDAPYADVVDFYKTEMENNGWTFNATLSTEFGEIAALTYEKDGRSATVSILTDTTTGKTLVAVTLLP